MPIITVLIYSERIQREKNRLAKAFIEDQDTRNKEERYYSGVSRRSSWKLVFFWY